MTTRTRWPAFDLLVVDVRGVPPGTVLDQPRTPARGTWTTSAASDVAEPVVGDASWLRECRCPMDCPRDHVNE